MNISYRLETCKNFILCNNFLFRPCSWSQTQEPRGTKTTCKNTEMFIYASFTQHESVEKIRVLNNISIKHQVEATYKNRQHFELLLEIICNMPVGKAGHILTCN